MLNEQMNKTYNLYQRGFIHRTSTENVLDTSPNTPTGEIMAVDPTQKMVEEEDKFQIYGNKGRGKPSYLSSTIREDITEKMRNKVQENIIKDIQEAKYCSLSVDSIPGISHTDQLTVVLQYARVYDGKGCRTHSNAHSNRKSRWRSACQHCFELPKNAELIQET
ncbi:hypothetical protein TNIN_178101 [Trichonephila inaurata madagascariensis]|uniref:Uncharacterized protein n=1 Tax=Trichonephila inaurata madagascariensis TaxID=2747483 RepID=A0A8X7C8F4_9ARAC|nr:hypothetical protein TNIN_178101 [Trichonephila inaurata madagascariensis]